jgi:hypothetical protein
MIARRSSLTTAHVTGINTVNSIATMIDLHRCCWARGSRGTNMVKYTVTMTARRSSSPSALVRGSNMANCTVTMADLQLRTMTVDVSGFNTANHTVTATGPLPSTTKAIVYGIDAVSPIATIIDRQVYINSVDANGTNVGIRRLHEPVMGSGYVPSTDFPFFCVTRATKLNTPHLMTLVWRRCRSTNSPETYPQLSSQPTHSYGER